jgi:hypothetical protein
MIYYAYTLGRTEDWRGFRSIKEYFNYYISGTDAAAEDLAWLVKMRRIVTAAYRWDGDPRIEAVSAIPSLDASPVLLYCAMKSRKTFIVSPQPLWHLHKGRGASHLGTGKVGALDFKYRSANCRIVEWRDEDVSHIAWPVKQNL